MYNIGTTFKIVDQSAITPIIEPVSDQKEVVFLSLITSDKGPEEFMKVSGGDFYDYFGKNISFAKHGQPLLQAAKIINAGGTLAVKRLVDKNAKLANAYICYGISIDDATKTISIKFKAMTNDIKSINDIDNFDEVLFAVTDIGRGASAKSFKITPEYLYSKNLNYIKYSVSVMENYKELERVIFNTNSEIVENGEINTFGNALKNSKQVKAKFYENNYADFLKTIADMIASDDEEKEAIIKELKTKDVLFGKGSKSSEDLVIKNKAGAEYKIVIDSTGDQLDEDTGISLSGGSDGDFKSFSADDGVYVAMATEFLEGKITDDIYDVDNYMIDLCVDANYPAEVKTLIKDLADFREDFFYLRDMGISSQLDNYTSIYNKLYNNGEDNPGDGIYVSDCSLYYNIIDPYTKKEITVTYGYKLSELLVDHMINNRNKPVAGLLYNMVFDDAIKGSVNYIPMRKPKMTTSTGGDGKEVKTIEIIDEREYMQDNRINYAAYYDGKLTLDCQYTRNNIYSQLSYINNILIVQQVIKAIRKECPKSRFSFLTGQDLEKYSEAVNTVIAKYKDNFAEISFDYVADSTMIANKIYNASIIVKFKDFVQSEIFTIFALGNE